MANQINARSPYFIYITDDGNLQSATLKLYVYTGTQNTSRPATPTYTLTSTAIDEKITFEISELVRDYIVNTFDGSYTSSAVWVDYLIDRTVGGVVTTDEAYTQLAGFDGYGYFKDGSQGDKEGVFTNINDQTVLQSNTTIYKYDDEPLRFPVHISEDTDITFLKNGNILTYTEYSTSTASADTIRYISTATNGIDNYTERVLNDGGSVEAVECIDLGEVSLYGVDTILVKPNSSGVQKFTVVNIDECKYTPYKITFVNKFGAYQDVWFFKKSSLFLTTNKDAYKSNIITNGTYNTYSRQNSILTKNGNEKLMLNTGFYEESYNEVFKQMSLSEEVWIEYEGQTLPVNIASSEFNYKTKLNDKLINYTIEVEFSNDEINNIR